MKFLEETFCFLGITKDSNFVVESDWKGKFSKSFQKLCFFTKTTVFRKKHELLKIAKSSSIAVEWDWKIENTQKFQYLCSSKDNSCFFRKKVETFENFKGSKTAVECDWNSQICQNVENIVLS